MKWKNEIGCYHNKLSVKEITRVLVESGLDENEFVIREQESGNSKDGVSSETVIEINKQ
jgi:hypothetical protein